MVLLTGSSRQASKSATNLLSTNLHSSSYVKGRQQSASTAGYSAGRRKSSSSVVGGQSPMRVLTSTPKSNSQGLRTARSSLQTTKQQTPKSEPRSTSLHGQRMSAAAAKIGPVQKNGFSLPVRQPTNSLPSSPHSSDPDSLDEPGTCV